MSSNESTNTEPPKFKNLWEGVLPIEKLTLESHPEAIWLKGFLEAQCIYFKRVLNPKEFRLSSHCDQTRGRWSLAFDEVHPIGWTGSDIFKVKARREMFVRDTAFVVTVKSPYLRCEEGTVFSRDGFEKTVKDIFAHTEFQDRILNAQIERSIINAVLRENKARRNER